MQVDFPRLAAIEARAGVVTASDLAKSFVSQCNEQVNAHGPGPRWEQVLQRQRQVARILLPHMTGIIRHADREAENPVVNVPVRREDAQRS